MNATKTNNWPATQLADEDFEFIRRLVYERSRISLGTDKKILVASRLAKRLQQLRLPGFRQYCEWLRSPAGDDELRFLIDRISTNHTFFFREMKHFDYLRETILPAWALAAAARSEMFHVWSAACSSGEEPYSLAIHLAEHLAPAESARWQIEASDISTRVLETAQGGIYEAGRLASVEAKLVPRHFQKGAGEWAGHFRVKEALRRRVQFHHLNLLEGGYPFNARFHLILCRNVMIYFDRPTQEALISRLSENLLPGGHLMVGHSESLSGIKHSLRPVQSAIYMKPLS
jgi:chemotaxis protein methyltransferase CheR